MNVSGFTYIHNALTGGYPIVEAIGAVLPVVDEVVVVDVNCTDGTIDLLRRKFAHNLRIIEGVWIPGAAGECLSLNHSLYKQCKGKYVLHFEADEVFDPHLAKIALNALDYDPTTPNVAVWRLQVEQNFQRVRWWPEPVHRIFLKASLTKKEGHTTEQHIKIPNDVRVIHPVYGYLWDVTNCFRDQFKGRCQQQAILWGHPVNYRLYSGTHASQGVVNYNEPAIDNYLKEDIWTWTRSPLDLPDNLIELVGVTNYAEYHS